MTYDEWKTAVRRACWTYANRIRNGKKKTYAAEYMDHLTIGIPDTPPEPPKGLSFMAAQAVRLGVVDAITEAERIARTWENDR